MSDFDNDMFRIFNEIEMLQVKKKPIGKFNYMSHVLGTKLVKSQSDPFKFVAKKDQMYMCNLKGTIEIYLSMFDEPTLFPAVHISQGYASFRDGQRFSEKHGGNSTHKLFLSIYADEIGLTNPLGFARNSNKLWNVFGQILNIPRVKRAKLNSIFWIASISSADFKKYSLNTCFKPILSMLKEIQKPFTHPGYSKPIQAVIYFFSGDAPASNHFAGIILFIIIILLLILHN